MDKSRTELLIGKENIEKIAKKHITIVGVGGVGGYVAIMLVRAGIEHLKLIDFDNVSSSNLNRQVVAEVGTIGKAKVDVLKDMLLKINENADIEIINDKICEENVSNYIGKTDIVVDAIDSVKDKIALIIYCKKNNINIISAMGAGNRYDIPNFYLTDIYKTHDDGLAKIIRKKLRGNGIKKLDVVTTDSKPIKCGSVIGSISYYPAVCGCTISAVVINKIIKEKI